MNEILEFIYKSKIILNSAKKITNGNDLYEDLISELIIIISGTNEGIIKGLYERGELELYCYKIMYNQYTNPRNEFYKKYRTFETQVEGEENIESNIDEQYSDVVKLMKTMYRNGQQAEIRLLQLKVKFKTYRAVGKELGLAYKTVEYVVKNITEQIRKQYDLSNNR